MRTMPAVVVAILIALHGSDGGSAKKSVPPFRAESSAYIVPAKDHWTYVTDNRSFTFADVLKDRGEGYIGLLLLETYRNEHTDGIEGVRGTATVDAWTLHGQQREPRWSFKGTGNEGMVQDRFFRVTAWGCCDVREAYSYYSLLTGKKLYMSNSDLLEVWGNGDGPQAWRYIAFQYSGMGQTSQSPRLQYGTDTRVAQSFFLVSATESYDAPQMFLSAGEKLEKSLDLRGSELTFLIVLKYDDGLELRIPVEADVVRPEKATLPEGYSVRAEN